MTNQKYLHELLRDEQEPFRLHNYIADRKGQIKRPNSSHRPPAALGSSLQVIKRNNTQTCPIAAQASSSKHNNLCLHSCFLAFNASPEITKSPFHNFLSPGTGKTSPAQNGSVFLNIPARTASLLLDAAMKIQKQQSTTKPKIQIKNLGLGLFSSILKKLKDRKRSRKREIGFGKLGNSGSLDNNSNDRIRSNRRDMLETSSSRLYEYENSDEIDYLVLAQQQDQNQHLHQLGDSSNRFCLSPLSPFRFSLQRSSSSSGGCTPIFASPSASPTNSKDQENHFNGVNELIEEFGNKEESDKDQSSPVSVLDPPFENQEEEDCHENLDYDEDDYDVQCSFALVQRAKEKLLYKLSRFERLAELDPIELEKRMQDDDVDDEVEYEVNGDVQNDQDLLLPAHRSCCSIDDSYVNQVLIKSNILHYRNKRVSSDVEKLISDLISEEKHTSITSINKYSENGEILVGRVCSKLEWWKATESSTIDMMAESDMRYELDHWKRFQKQKEETCLDFEVAILGLLVEEFTYELLQAK